MKQNQYLFLLFALIVLTGCGGTQKKLTEYVNPFLGTATLWEPEDLGYTRKIKSRTWGAETYPGATLPNAMVQLSPVTQFRSGAGYQYEDTVIYGFHIQLKGIGTCCMSPCCQWWELSLRVIIAPGLVTRRNLRIRGITKFIWNTIK